MHTRKWFLFLLSILLPLALLAGCGRDLFSTTAAAAAIAAQGRNVEIRFDTSAELDDALRKAVQSGGSLTEIRLAILQELGLEDAAFFSESGLPSAREGQHAVQVYKVTGGAASHAASQVAKELEQAIRRLASGGEYDGAIAMATNAQQYYLAVDVTVVEAPGEEIENSKNITVFVHYSSAGNVDDQFTKVKEGVSGTDGLDSKFSIPIKEALQENKPIKDNSEGAINFGAGKLGNDLAKLVLQYGTALFGQSEETLSSLLNEQHQTDYKNAKCVLLENLEETVKLLPATENYVKAYVVCTYQSAMENDAAATENLKNALVQKVKDNIKLQGEEKNFTLNNRKYRIYYNWGAANECDMIKIKTENGYLYAAALRLVFSYTEL